MRVDYSEIRDDRLTTRTSVTQVLGASGREHAARCELVARTVHTAVALIVVYQ